MKRCVVLLLFLLLLLLVVGCSAKNESVSQKNDSISHYQGYGIETWKKGDELTVKTDNSEFSVKVLPKKLNLNQEFALETWREILEVRFPKKDEYLEKIKAKEEIRLLIEVLAARIKVGKMNFKDVPIGFKDVEKALNILWETSFIAADRFVGNWDGYCSNPEIYKLKMSPQSRIVGEMTKTYSSF